jgi:hypothetical protein
MDHINPSLETAHPCYGQFIEYFFFMLQCNRKKYVMTYSQSGNGEIRRIPEVLAIKALALVIRVPYGLFSEPSLISSVDEASIVDKKYNFKTQILHVH